MCERGSRIACSGDSRPAATRSSAQRVIDGELATSRSHRSSRRGCRRPMPRRSPGPATERRPACTTGTSRPMRVVHGTCSTAAWAARIASIIAAPASRRGIGRRPREHRGGRGLGGAAGGDVARAGGRDPVAHHGDRRGSPTTSRRNASSFRRWTRPRSLTAAATRPGRARSDPARVVGSRESSAIGAGAALLAEAVAVLQRRPAAGAAANRSLRSCPRPRPSRGWRRRPARSARRDRSARRASAR